MSVPTFGDLGSLPVRLTAEQAFELLGVGHGIGYEMLNDGRIPAIRAGVKWIVPTASLLRMLGVESNGHAATEEQRP